MVSFFLKNVLRKAVLKIATDEKARSKFYTVINNAKELNKRGELMKSLGKSAARLKNKIKRK